MFIVNLIGGLGNQMFQYAFGRALSIERGILVKFSTVELLDRTAKENFTFRDYELGIFKAQVTIASENEVHLYKRQPIALAERAYYKIVRKLNNVNVFNESTHYFFDSKVYNTSLNTYYDGYWQNEKYFAFVEEIIRKDFSFRKDAQGLNENLLRQIQDSNAIAVHIRRGDYVSNPLSNEVHGTCSPAYYQQAVELLRSKTENPTLFVFSDEPDWVREHLTFELPTVYISHNEGSNSYEDMRLMSCCHHNIIANSSFSWWGAWLNNNPNKIVVAPRQWMQSQTIDSTDLVPSSWIKL